VTVVTASSVLFERSTSLGALTVASLTSVPSVGASIVAVNVTTTLAPGAIVPRFEESCPAEWVTTAPVEVLPET